MRAIAKENPDALLALIEAARGAVKSLHRTPAWAWSIHLHELERALKPFEDE